MINRCFQLYSGRSALNERLKGGRTIGAAVLPFPNRASSTEDRRVATLVAIGWIQKLVPPEWA